MIHISKASKSIYVFLVSCIYVFLYMPLIVLVLYSFNQGGFPDIWRGFSLHWYVDLLNSVDIWRAFTNSIIVAFCSATLSVLMAIFFIHGSRKQGIDWTALFYSNIVISDIVLAVGLLALFSAISVPLGLTTLIAGHTLLGLGFVIPVIKNRYDELDDSIIEASLDLGASSQYTFLHVTIPFLYPAIFSAFLLAVIVSFDDFLISFFCSGASVQTLSLYIFSMIRSGVSPVVNALSTILLLISLLLMIGILMFQKNVLHK
ncbi:ABC transporter permease [Candidatus Dependentiae bacterium]|nr:ABC transporter permease [Candidatus Dependentiae bacterium]